MLVREISKVHQFVFIKFKLNVQKKCLSVVNFECGLRLSFSSRKRLTVIHFTFFVFFLNVYNYKEIN